MSITDEENEKNFNDEHLKMKESFTTVLKNHPKCRILNFPILAFFTNFCLVTLFDRKLQFFKTRQNVPFLALLTDFCPLKM